MLQQLLATAGAKQLSMLAWTVRVPACDLPVPDEALPVELHGTPETTERVVANIAWASWSAYLDTWCGPGAIDQHTDQAGRTLRHGHWVAPTTAMPITLRVVAEPPTDYA